MRNLRDRFFDKVLVRGEDECWPWQAARDDHGYGKFFFQGQMVTAHRVAFYLATGELPKDKEIIHSCDYPPCQNDAHLSPATHAQNMADMKAKGRARSGCIKVSEAEARAIYALCHHNPLKLSQEFIGLCFGLDQSQVSRIANRKVWVRVLP